MAARPPGDPRPGAAQRQSAGRGALAEPGACGQRPAQRARAEPPAAGRPPAPCIPPDPSAAPAAARLTSARCIAPSFRRPARARSRAQTFRPSAGPVPEGGAAEGAASGAGGCRRPSGWSDPRLPALSGLWEGSGAPRWPCCDQGRAWRPARPVLGSWHQAAPLPSAPTAALIETPRAERHFPVNLFCAFASRCFQVP